MSLLRTLQQSGALRTLDDAFANTLRRLHPDTPDDVLAAAALASLAVANGHAGFDPAAPRHLVDADIAWPEPEAWMQQIAASPLVATPHVPTDEAEAAPLVFERTAQGRGLLYLRRYREYERRLALQLQRIASQTVDRHPREGGGPWTSAPEVSESFADLAPLFAQLFPANAPHPTPLPQAGEGTTTADPHQARAAALALRRALLLVTGGPGTGKTTTIARLLVLRIAQARQAGRAAPCIALTAPTGRAAERMATSLRRAVAQMAAQGIDASLLDALPTNASTLHRLLGTIPDSPRFRHHADNPLPYDIVVVDEASMVDLPLMCKLTEAVADGAQLILLGDPDQLPSVEAGDVLAAILGAAGPGDALNADDAEALQPLLGPTSSHAREAGGAGSGSGPLRADTNVDPELDRHPRESGDPWRSALEGVTATSMDLLASLAPSGPASGRSARSALVRLRGSDGNSQEAVATQQSLHGHRVHLQHGWRQSDTLHLAPLADAVRNGNTVEALHLLRGCTLANVHFDEGVDDPLQAQPDLLVRWRALATLTDPAHALREANRLRLLTALREGAQGARGLNARIEAALSGRRIGTPPAWFPGRLLLVTQNSYRHGLFNGDVGICLPDDSGTPLAWFPGDASTDVRAFHPAALPAHESAFAMTVHKAQGSEFDEVWLQLPRQDARVLSRELLYTAITRARSALHIAGSADVIAAALSRHASRVSGLGWRLGEAQN
jgi:exodeoxyribonuclease V alpha subunit